MKRIFVTLILAAIPVVGLVSQADAQQVGKVSRGKLATACKVGGGTTYTGANGRYGCIVTQSDGWSDSITCTKSGCFHERWPPVTIVGTTPRPPTVTPVTGSFNGVLGGAVGR